MTAARDSASARVLVVAHRTAATPRLIEAVGARAQAGSCVFTLLVPSGYWDPDTEAATLTLDLALPLLEEAAGAHITGVVGASDPLVAVRDALGEGSFDEVIISTLPERVSHWLRRDLPSRVERLGVPVTVVSAQERREAPAQEPRGG